MNLSLLHAARSHALRLMNAIDGLSAGIAEVAKELPSAAADDYIENELAKFAVQMRRYQGMGRSPAASVGYEVDVWLRERISAVLAEKAP